MLSGEFAQQLEKLTPLQEQTVVRGDGLNDDSGDATAFASKQVAQSCVVVEGQHAGAFGECDRHTRRGRLAEGRKARARGYEKMIGVAVVTTGEFDDQIAARKRAGETDRAHRGLGTRRHEANLLEPGIGSDHSLGQLHFALAGGSVGGAVAQGLDHGFLDRGVRVAEDQGAPGAHEIQIFAPLDVVNKLASAASYEERRSANCAKRPHG